MPDSGPTRAEPPLISSKGLYLPSWAIALVGAAVISVISLAVESRVRLGAQDAAIRELQQAVVSLRAEAQIERDRIGEQITQIKVTLAAICAATGARCP
ncbi:MAG: hypothetical protein ACO3S5_13020 [Ilumatobacteraceae bacterium]